MNPRARSVPFLTLLASVAVLAGCGGGNANVPTASQSSSALATLPHTAKAKGGGGGGIIYTAQLYGNDIVIYLQGPSGLTSQGSITNGVSSPQGSVTTPSGWFYVANSGNQDVLVYSKKVKAGGSPSTVLQDYGQTPVNVDVNASRKLVAVSNSGTASQTGSVSIYLNGSAVPSRTLAFGSDILTGYGIALNKQGDCFWGTYDTTSGTGNIIEFSGCKEPGSVAVSNVGNAGGLAFDQSGDLLYINRSGSTPAIYVCKKLSKCSPNTFTTGEYQLYKPVNMNFDKHGKHLWVADAAGYVDEFTLTQGKHTLSFVNQYRVGSSDAIAPFGIAPKFGS